MATWGYWNDASSTSTDATTVWTGWASSMPASSPAVWYSWADQGTASTTTSVTTSGTGSAYVWPKWVEIYEETVEQIQAREIRQAEAARAAERRMAEMARAEAERAAAAKAESERALKLLREHLSAEQAESLDKKGEFEVVGQSGKRYAIKRGYAGNVYSLDERRRKVAKHCIHPVESVADYDAMLAQMLWLKWNEVEFHKTANTTPMPQSMAA